MKQQIRDGEEIMPQVFLFGRDNGETAMFPLVGVEAFFASKDSKRLLRPVVKKIWEKVKIDKPNCELVAVFLLSDTWVETVATEEWEKMGRQRSAPFEPKPGMAEALLVQVSLSDSDVCYQWPYVRGENDVVFTAKPRNMRSLNDGTKALLMGLWPL